MRFRTSRTWCAVTDHMQLTSRLRPSPQRCPVCPGVRWSADLNRRTLSALEMSCRVFLCHTALLLRVTSTCHSQCLQIFIATSADDEWASHYQGEMP